MHTCTEDLLPKDVLAIELREEQRKAMRFIVWDRVDGNPNQDDQGNITSDGILGRVAIDNVYVSVYASYQDKLHTDLGVGECALAEFNLSGSKGSYLVYRVA